MQSFLETGAKTITGMILSRRHHQGTRKPCSRLGHSPSNRRPRLLILQAQMMNSNEPWHYPWKLNLNLGQVTVPRMRTGQWYLQMCVTRAVLFGGQLIWIGYQQLGDNSGISNEEKSYNDAIQASLEDFVSTNESDFFPIDDTVREGGRSAVHFCPTDLSNPYYSLISRPVALRSNDPALSYAALVGPQSYPY